MSDTTDEPCLCGTDFTCMADVHDHDCRTCPDCLHDGQRCCGCYDGACCKENAQPDDRCRLPAPLTCMTTNVMTLCPWCEHQAKMLARFHGWSSPLGGDDA